MKQYNIIQRNTENKNHLIYIKTVKGHIFTNYLGTFGVHKDNDGMFHLTDLKSGRCICKSDQMKKCNSWFCYDENIKLYKKVTNTDKYKLFVEQFNFYNK